MSKTKIEWATDRWNPITGCPGPKVSPGCDNCYAERMAQRLAGRCGYDRDDPFGIHVHHERWLEPFGWRKPRRVFVCTMGDLFHKSVSDSYIAQVFAVAAHLPQHTFMLLTKRPERMLKIMNMRSTAANDMRGAAYTEIARLAGRDRNMDGLPWPLPNVWLGVTVCNQAEADAKIPLLLETPAAKRFVSVEPMLGSVDLCRKEFLGPWLDAPYGSTGLDWVICGGETGPKARPMHPAWACSLRDQCVEAGVPYFFKGWGEWCVYYDRDVDDPDWRCCPKVDDDKTRYLNLAGGWGFHGERVVAVRRVGKKRAGRLLDGKEWSEVPE